MRIAEAIAQQIGARSTTATSRSMAPHALRAASPSCC